MPFLTGGITAIVYFFLAFNVEKWLFETVRSLPQSTDLGVVLGLVALLITLGPVIGLGLFLTFGVGALTAAIREK